MLTDDEFSLYCAAPGYRLPVEAFGNTLSFLTQKLDFGVIQTVKTDLKSQAFFTSQFSDSGSRRQASAQNRQMACRFDRVLHPLDDVLRFKVKFWHVLEIFCDSLSRDSHLITIDDFGVLKKIFKQGRDSTNLVHVFHVVLARRP